MHTTRYTTNPEPDNSTSPQAHPKSFAKTNIAQSRAHTKKTSLVNRRLIHQRWRSFSAREHFLIVFSKHRITIFLEKGYEPFSSEISLSKVSMFVISADSLASTNPSSSEKNSSLKLSSTSSSLSS